METKSVIDILEKQGWKKQFIASEPRLSEAVEVYKNAGFEIHLEPLPEVPECNRFCPGDEQETTCKTCFEGYEDQYKIIFTRKRKDRMSSENNLFKS